jgi:bacillithiol synthase
MTEPIVRTDALGGSPLSRAARAGELPQWFVPLPATADAWQTHAKAVRESIRADWYERLRPAIAATGAAAARLERSAGGGGLVVTTGQQPGLFGGPLMTIVKAISARALADELQQTLGIPVAPLFWAATDDADFDEAAVVSVALEGGAHELRLAERAPAGTPMARVPLDHDIDALARALRDACGSAPHAAYLARALAAYHDGATVGGSYVELLRNILEPLEIAVFDVSHASVNDVAIAVLERAATRAGAVSNAVHARNEEIVARGFTPQVDEVPGLSVVFENAHGTKRRLPIAEAESFLGKDGATLSATVLLRPVLERAIFPTAAYVAGPGEMAYFAQVTAVADALEIPKPLVVPRWSMTIIEPRVQRVLDEFDIAAESLADPHAVESRIARAHLPPDAAEALEKLRIDIGANLDRLSSGSRELIDTRVVDGLGRTLEHRLARVERRLAAAVKRREVEVMRKLGTARGSLFPFGVKQERKLGYIPFLARYGPGLLEQMLAQANVHARQLVRRDAPAERDAIPAAR